MVKKYKSCPDCHAPNAMRAKTCRICGRNIAEERAMVCTGDKNGYNMGKPLRMIGTTGLAGCLLVAGFLLLAWWHSGAGREHGLVVELLGVGTWEIVTVLAMTGAGLLTYAFFWALAEILDRLDILAGKRR